MKITLTDLIEVVKEVPYYNNKVIVVNAMVELLQKKDKTFTGKKAMNFRKKCEIC